MVNENDEKYIFKCKEAKERNTKRVFVETERNETGTKSPESNPKEGLIEIWIFLFALCLIFYTLYMCSLFIYTVSFNYILVTLHFGLLFYEFILFMDSNGFFSAVSGFPFSLHSYKMLAIFLCFLLYLASKVWRMASPGCFFMISIIARANGFHFRHQFTISLFELHFSIFG